MHKIYKKIEELDSLFWKKIKIIIILRLNSIMKYKKFN